MPTTTYGTPYVASSDLVSAYPGTSSTLATRIDDISLKGNGLNDQTGTSYTLVLTDGGKTITLNNAAAVTVTIPTNTSVAFPLGTEINFVNKGAGTVTIQPTGGVTLNGGNLTLAQNAAVQVVKLETNTWGQLESVGTPSGLTLMTPTSTTNTGGTVTTSGGAVTFTGISAVSLNGVFTSSFENYVVQVTQSVGSTAGALNVRLRASGSDAAGSNYSYAGQYSVFASGTGAIAGNNLTSFKGHDYNTTPATSCIYYVHSPQLAVFTQLHSTRVNQDGGSYVMGVHKVATSYDGISFIPDAGNASGIVRVYGFRK